MLTHAVCLAARLMRFSGDDLSLRFEDWLGEPEMSSQYFADLHATMEKKHGMM
jgi:hypothetical protein